MKAKLFVVLSLLALASLLVGAVSAQGPQRSWAAVALSGDSATAADATVPNQIPAVDSYALKFNGHPNFLVVGQSPSINIGLSMTIEFWVKTTASYGGPSWHDAEWVLDKDIIYEVKRDWAVVIRFGKVVFNNGNPNGSGDQPISSNSSINDGIWHHVAVTRDISSGKTTIYIDGRKDAENYFSTDDLSNTLPLYIGAENGASGPSKRSFIGELDELRLWNIVRSEQEIRSYMFRRLNGNETGLVGYWQFDEGGGQTAFDATPFHNDGQLGSSSGPDDNDPQWTLRGGGGPGFSIAHIEVTQAIQDASNSVPLIAGKPTFVRVYVSCPPDGQVENADIALRGFGPSGELGVPLAPFGGYLSTACQESFEAQRANLRKTLNFDLPNEWAQGTVTLRAEVGEAVGEETVLFTPGKKLRIAWVSMPYIPPQPPPPPPPPGPTPTPVVVHPDQAVAAKAITDVVLMYPIALRDVKYVFQPGFDQFMRDPFTCPPPYSYCPADTQYLQALNDFWNRMVREGRWAGGQQPDRLYGWVRQAAQGTLCGIADAIWDNSRKRKGRVAAGLDSCGWETLAHELGHLLNSTGLRHAPGCDAAGPDPSYPNPDGSIGEWGVRITQKAIELFDPAHTYDFMSYCSPEWISPYNYRNLTQGFAPVNVRAAAQMLAAPQRQVLVSGIVFSPALTVTLSPLFAITSSVPPDPDAGGAYCLELQSSDRTVLDSRCFDLTFTNPETGEPTGADGFSLALPYPDGTQAVVLTHNGLELARAAASPSIPQVRVLSPNGGELWEAGGTYTVTWTAGDDDGETLHYAISFSPDGGVSWNPLVLHTTETQWVVDASSLPGSTNALIRVEVSDGFHSAADISDAPFTIEPKRPQAFILSPEGDVTIPVGMPLWLQGYAYDLEDGALPEAALRWSSSRDGDLGTGSQVLVSLSSGEHTITFMAADSDGNPATATVRVYVGNRLYLPLVLRGQ